MSNGSHAAVRRSDRPAYDMPGLDAYLDAITADPGVRTFVRELAEQGVGLLDLDAEALRLCDQAIADTEPYFAGGLANRVQDAWRRSPAIRALATNRGVASALRAAYGREPAPFQTLTFRCGSQQELHTDSDHFHSEPAEFMCGVWIALEDVEPGSGPLLYVPGSHRLPELTYPDGRRPTKEDYGLRFLPAMAERLRASGLPVKRAMLKKGQALVWTARLAHGGAPIENPSSTRRSLVVHYYFRGCNYYTPLDSGPHRQRLAIRLPPNIRTGGLLWPTSGGFPVWPDWSTVRMALSDWFNRRVYPLQ